jgi:hypothetical protein
MVGGAILFLLAIKMLIVKNRVKQQYDAFVHPELCIDEVKARVGSAENAENTLKAYIINAQTTPERIRNFALVVAYLNSLKKTPTLKVDIQTFLDKLESVDPTTRKYREYIVESIKDWK